MLRKVLLGAEFEVAEVWIGLRGIEIVYKWKKYVVLYFIETSLSIFLYLDAKGKY
jgi:hypothetical protein